MELKILSGGAANGLVTAIQPAFTRETGMTVSGDFGAVGGMRDRVLAGEAVDVLVLTRAIIDGFAEDDVVVGDSVHDVGGVATSVAVREGAEPCDVSNADALRGALLAADAIYFPDPDKATAGIHFAKVLSQLGIADTVADRLRLFPNGQTAMAAMAKGDDANPIGCTQITEILNTPGVRYVGGLPEGCGLVTTYTAAVATRAASPEAALSLVSMLVSPGNRELRRKAGFSDPE